jgi:hypothetical protein
MQGRIPARVILLTAGVVSSFLLAACSHTNPNGTTGGPNAAVVTEKSGNHSSHPPLARPDANGRYREKDVIEAGDVHEIKLNADKRTCSMRVRKDGAQQEEWIQLDPKGIGETACVGAKPERYKIQIGSAVTQSRVLEGGYHSPTRVYQVQHPTQDTCSVDYVAARPDDLDGTHVGGYTPRDTAECAKFHDGAPGPGNMFSWMTAAYVMGRSKA